MDFDASTTIVGLPVAQVSPSAAPLYPPFNAGAQASPSAAAEEIAVEESQDSEGDY